MPLNTKYSLADHEALFSHPRCPINRQSIILDLQAAQFDQARTRLRQAYRICHGLEAEHWNFLENLAHLRHAATSKTVLDAPIRGKRVRQNIHQGHSTLRDMHGVDAQQLIDLGLIRHPSVDGETRKRLNRKPYYVITPEAVDVIDVAMVGRGIGDLGESITHVLGCRLYGDYWKAYLRQTGDYHKVQVYYYQAFPRELGTKEQKVDVVIRVQDDERSRERIWSVAEIETGVSRPADVLDDMRKIGQIEQAPRKHWVCPTRAVCTKIVNLLAERQWLGMRTVSDTLALEAEREDIRDLNERMGDAPWRGSELGLHIPSRPIDSMYSYDLMARYLKGLDGAVFDPPVVRDM